MESLPQAQRLLYFEAHPLAGNFKRMAGLSSPPKSVDMWDAHKLPAWAECRETSNFKCALRLLARVSLCHSDFPRPPRISGRKGSEWPGSPSNLNIVMLTSTTSWRASQHTSRCITLVCFFLQFNISTTSTYNHNIHGRYISTLVSPPGELPEMRCTILEPNLSTP